MEERRKFVRVEWPIVVQYKTLEEPYTQDQSFGRDSKRRRGSFTVYERLQKVRNLTWKYKSL